MKFKIAGIFAAALLAFSTQQANAVPTVIEWSGTCLDCAVDPSPASATITLGDRNNVIAFSYSSLLFEFTADTELLSGGFFDETSFPVPANFFVSGTANLGFDVDGPLEQDFIFSTLAVPQDVLFGHVVFEGLDWALCINPIDNNDLACTVLEPAATNDFGDSSTFGLASVPEPSTLAVVGLGIAGLAAIRRRRRSA